MADDRTVLKHDEKGRFVRKASSFRNFVTKDGSSGFKAESGRYHFYFSLACPWAGRVYSLINLKGLQDCFTLSFVAAVNDERGWHFDEPEPNHGKLLIRDLYHLADENYDGRYTVPVMWDKQKNTIVNNESSEIILMLNSEFNEFAKNPDLDLYPEDLRPRIDDVNEMTYTPINNGVYMSGFAKSQEAYEEAVYRLFDALDKMEVILNKSRYLCGDRLTLADIRLFVTLIRFQPVYFGHFKCNLRPLTDYPALWNYVKEVYQLPEIKSTIDFAHIKEHYYATHLSVNPTGIVPVGGLHDMDGPHDRATRQYN